MVAGLVGLVIMAIPAVGRGHGMLGNGGHSAHPLLGHGHAHGSAATAKGELIPADLSHSNALRWIPSPRTVCSSLALYGAFGNALVHAAHLSFAAAAITAVIPALLIERLLLNPLWNFVFRFQTPPSSPFETLVLSEARALDAFRNGKGLVETVRDGRRIQLMAELQEDQARLPIKVGTVLLIVDVDAGRERLIVTVLPPT